MPWVRIDKEYRFETDEGTTSLADLFRGRSQFFVYHFMFRPDYAAGCPSCSAIADGFEGFVVHLANHDVTLCAVARAPLAKLQAYRRRMGLELAVVVVRERCCSSVCETLKSWLKSLPSEDLVRVLCCPMGADDGGDDTAERSPGSLATRLN